jgi:hypothetical protein
MTLEQIKALSDEQVRVRIAELCGFALGSKLADWLPDYLNDLNACRQMEDKSFAWCMCVPTDRTLAYIDALIMICGTAIEAYHATARQRCNAFLAVMGGEE